MCVCFIPLLFCHSPSAQCTLYRRCLPVVSTVFIIIIISSSTNARVLSCCCTALYTAQCFAICLSVYMLCVCVCVCVSNIKSLMVMLITVSDTNSSV